MATKPSKALQALSKNLAALLRHQAEIGGEYLTQPKLAKGVKVDQKTIWRIDNMLHEPSLDKVEKIAKAFGLEAWQLLVPGFEPASPPTIESRETTSQ